MNKLSIVTYTIAFLIGGGFLLIGLYSYNIGEKYSQNSCQISFPGFNLSIWLKGAAIQELIYSLVLFGFIVTLQVTKKLEVILLISSCCFLFSLAWSVAGVILLILNIFCLPTFLYIVSLVNVSIPWIIFYIGNCILKKWRKFNLVRG